MIRVQALCGICRKPVPHAYFENGQLVADDGWAICNDKNVVYHYEPGNDCWGIKTGYPNFTTEVRSP